MSSNDPPKAIDRKRLRHDLEQVAKVTAKITSDKIRAFAKEHEIDLPLPGLLLSRGLQSLLLSKVQELAKLPEADLRNVLRLIEWHIGVALRERDPDLEPSQHPAVRASIDRVLNTMTEGGAASAAAPEEEPAPTT